MPPLMLPETFMPLAAALVPCFTAPTYRTFCFLVAGWVHCVGRHTVTRVALAAGVVGTMGERGWLSGWHISVCHRFFARATWNLDHLGLMVFRLALRWVPTDGTDQALVVLVDDTLARKGGKAIALGSMHHDPLLSSVRKAFSSFGHVWVVLALWVPLPFGPRGGAKGVALPLLFRLYVGSKRGNRADAASGGARRTSGSRYRRAEAAFPPPERRPTKPQLAREELALVGQWAAAFAPERTVYVVGDTAYTNRTTMEGRPANVQVVGHMRVDAALFGPPPPRQPGQRGRSRTRGARLPTPQAMATTRGARGTWHRLRLVLYGKTVTPLVFRGTALWYGALRESPVRFVVVRDPSGRRRDEAFFCTDLTVSVCFLLETYAKRWALEVTFFDCKQSLGFEDPQNQTARAVRRTAPFAALVYTLVALWGAHEVAAGRAPRWVSRPWYRHKATLAFTDLLTAFRQASVCRAAHAAPPIAAAPCPPRRPRKSRPCARALVGAFTRRP